jgi:Tol biopolymer transport system component
MQTIGWAADGKNLFVGAFPDGNGRLLEVNPDGHAQVLLEKPFSWIGQPVASPDGKHIAFVNSTNDSTVTLLEQF